MWLVVTINCGARESEINRYQRHMLCYSQAGIVIKEIVIGS